MPFSSQFALSLELTKLIPLGLAAASNATEALLSLARDLQGSGSDIVIEADLAELFGRSLIDKQMASTFRTVVAKSNTIKLCEGIALESGPGPTTRRAFAPDQDAYFSTVIQCSFLTFVLQKSSLASAVKSFFEKQAEDAAPEHSVRAGPSEDGIFGFLQACEDQTSSYNWGHQLLAVATMLNYSELDDAFKAVPTTVFHGLLTTLHSVQRFPESQMMQIECGTGECWIVVWAHHILGLSVLVKTWMGGICTEVLFGLAPAVIIIDARNVVNYKIREPSLTLLGLTDENEKESPFTFKPDPDEPKIESIFRIPAKGYGKSALRSLVSSFGSNDASRDAIVRDMISITCAFAFIISKSLCASLSTMSTSDEGNEEEFDEEDEEEFDEQDEEGLDEPDIEGPGYEHDARSEHEGERARPIVIDEQRLLEAGQFIFNRQHLNDGAIRQHVDLYSSKPLNRTWLEPPVVVTAAFEEHIHRDEYWHMLIDTAKYLSILILAFAHVRDLNACADLLLHHQYAILIRLPLAKDLRVWKGLSSLDIDEFTWLRAISLLMINNARMNEDGAALLSDRGWSIYLTTFSLDEPCYTDSGFVVIKKGTPCRNHVYKHLIVDNLDKGRLDISDWQVVCEAGETLSLQCVNQVTLGRPFCGERRDTFVVALRMSFQDNDVLCMRRTGYRELFSALWAVQRIKACDHPLRKNEKVVLPPEFASVSGFGDLDAPDVSTARVLICLTANNEIARWRALLAIAHARSKRKLRGYEQVMLRGPDCCLNCVIKKAALQLGKWFIVL